MRFIHSNSQVNKDTDVTSLIGGLHEYSSHLQHINQSEDYSALEASLLLAKSEDTLQLIEKDFKDKRSEVKLLILIGIGGSNLGALAIHKALSNENASLTPKLITLDTVHAEDIEVIEQQYTTEFLKKHALVVCVSKSGHTTETIAQAELVAQLFDDRESFYQNVVLVTDENSALYQLGIKHNVSVYTLPKMVGGRFSVFSAVGLVPLYILGYDCKSLLKGARDILPFCVQNDDLYHNPAVVSAAYQYYFSTNGYIVHDFFTFLPNLESVGKWYRQLLGESIGKYSDVQDRFVGILPTVSVGSTDLHSVGQFYLGGQQFVMTTFIYSNVRYEKTFSKHNRVFDSLVEMITDKNIDDVNTAILEGTKEAYNECNLPFFEIELSGINEYELGSLMQFKMIEVMYLGILCNINPFDQPNVELYKKFTRDNLEKNK